MKSNFAGMGPWAASDLWRGNSEPPPMISLGYFKYGKGACAPVSLAGIEKIREVGLKMLDRHFPEAATDPWDEQG